MNQEPEGRKRFWSQWCMVHDGFPPIQNSTSYRCANCGALACEMDIFETKNGNWCGNCVQQLLNSEEWQKELQRFELTKSRASIAKITIVFVEVLLLQGAVLQFSDARLRNGIVDASIGVYMVMVGLIALTIFGVLLLFLKQKKAQQPAVKNK